MKLTRLLHRDPAAPTLRERATALREGLSRREAVLGAAIVAMPLTAIAADEAPDANLLAYGATIIELVARSEALYPAYRDLEIASHEVVGAAPPAFTPECRIWFEALRAEEARNGCVAAKEAYEAADSALLSLLCEIASIPAKTFAGLVFKARLAREHEIEELTDGIVADLLALSAPLA